MAIASRLTRGRVACLVLLGPAAVLLGAQATAAAGDLAAGQSFMNEALRWNGAAWSTG